MVMLALSTCLMVILALFLVMVVMIFSEVFNSEDLKSQVTFGFLASVALNGTVKTTSSPFFIVISDFIVLSANSIVSSLSSSSSSVKVLMVSATQTYSATSSMEAFLMMIVLVVPSVSKLYFSLSVTSAPSFSHLTSQEPVSSTVILTSCPVEPLVVDGNLATKFTFGSSTSSWPLDSLSPSEQEISPASITSRLKISNLCFLPSTINWIFSLNSISVPFLNHLVLASPLLISISKTAFSPQVDLTVLSSLVNSGASSMTETSQEISWSPTEQTYSPS